MCILDNCIICIFDGNLLSFNRFLQNRTTKVTKDKYFINSLLTYSEPINKAYKIIN